MNKAAKAGTKQEQSSSVHRVGESQTGKLLPESYTWQKHCGATMVPEGDRSLGTEAVLSACVSGHSLMVSE